MEFGYDSENQYDQVLRYASTDETQLVASTSYNCSYDQNSRLTGMVHARDVDELANCITVR